MFDRSLWSCLRHPCDQLRAFDLTESYTKLPYRTWGWLVAIAVFGSGLYGASLSFVLPQWSSTDGALWLILSAGLGWCIFGPALVIVTRRKIFTCAHACLVTMAYGEAVLVTGAAINLILSLAPGLLDPSTFNLSWVGLSNIIMAATLTLQLQAVNVPGWKTLLVWLAVLNGSGAIFFFLFQRLLQGVF